MFFIHQHDQMDCGPACLSMIAKYYGKEISIDQFRKYSHINKEGVSLLGISEAAQHVGFETLAVNISIDELLENAKSLPCILHWNKNHFVVLFKITQKIFSKKKVFYIADPAYGIIKINEHKLKESWLENNKGIALFLGPTNEFDNYIELSNKKDYFKIFAPYLKPYKRQLWLMFLLLILGSTLTFLLPFLTQNLIDKGVNAKKINIIILVLVAQLALFLGSIVFQVIRNWLTLKVGAMLSITVISDFLYKLFRLPISFFETKNIGDFNQRVIDNERIEKFLTSHSLNTFFSIITFSVFFVVLWYYDFVILGVYTFFTSSSLVWSMYWLKRRKSLDYFRFQSKGEHQQSMYEIINGVTEMKLNQMEDIKIKNWEQIQNKLLLTNTRILRVEQIQLSGFEFINQLKNILVTFIAATLVVKMEITLGAMLSISYIIGQMNTPINQLVDFFRSSQDAKLSMDRLHEVQNHIEEEQPEQYNMQLEEYYPQNGTDRGIHFKNVSFQFGGAKSKFVLQNIDFVIPEGKVTAIVGASGSGKTTLMKLLLKFYKPTKGNIFYNYDDLEIISPKSLRENCGVVMQDGYIFSDTIERNIACGDEIVDTFKLQNAVRIANIKDYIESLPLEYNTKIGASGNGISGGQQQRILIARAVYKNPHYIFFDEATSALDAENEKIIHDNLQSFFKGKTVLIVAHRLSTVKNANQIIVLKNGKIVEKGNHQKLVQKRADYYNLVKNQLELGN